MACKYTTRGTLREYSLSEEAHKRKAPYFKVQSIEVKHCAMTNVKTCIQERTSPDNEDLS